MPKDRCPVCGEIGYIEIRRVGWRRNEKGERVGGREYVYYIHIKEVDGKKRKIAHYAGPLEGYVRPRGVLRVIKEDREAMKPLAAYHSISLSDSIFLPLSLWERRGYEEIRRDPTYREVAALILSEVIRCAEGRMEEILWESMDETVSALKYFVETISGHVARRDAAKTYIHIPVLDTLITLYSQKISEDVGTPQKLALLNFASKAVGSLELLGVLSRSLTKIAKIPDIDIPWGEVEHGISSLVSAIKSLEDAIRMRDLTGVDTAFKNIALITSNLRSALRAD